MEVLQQEENHDDSSLNTAIGEHGAQEHTCVECVTTSAFSQFHLGFGLLKKQPFHSQHMLGACLNC